MKGDIAMGVAADSTGFTIVGHTQGHLAAAPKGDLDVFVRRYKR
jgi:hypothetical protein